MNPFDANERHRYIIESGGNPVCPVLKKVYRKE